MKIQDLHPSLKVEKNVDPKHPHIGFVIPCPPPSELGKQKFSVKLMNEAQNALNKLPSYEEMDNVDKLINYLFIRREAVQSSRMEGTWSTIDAVLTPVESSDSLDSSLSSVRGYAHALESIYDEAFKKKEKIFSLKTISHIHKEIMQKDPVYQGTPGLIRQVGKPGSIVYIGGLSRPEDSIYNPAPPKAVKNSLNEVLDWYSDKGFAALGDAGVGMNLILRIAIGHAHFEAVHPFPDGNGRVGRAIWPLQMIAAGSTPLYLSGYVEREKRDYYEALQAAQKKLNYEKLINFISEAIIFSSLEMRATKEKILNLPTVWQKRGQFRKNSAAEKALFIILKMPIFTTNDLKKAIGCSGPAAAKAVDDLVKKHVIRERTGHKRNRIFSTDEVIALLSREHGSDPDLALERAMQKLMQNSTGVT